MFNCVGVTTNNSNISSFVNAVTSNTFHQGLDLCLTFFAVFRSNCVF